MVSIIFKHDYYLSRASSAEQRSHDFYIHMRSLLVKILVNIVPTLVCCYPPLPWFLRVWCVDPLPLSLGLGAFGVFPGLICSCSATEWVLFSYRSV
jgi:hypothetical protein